MEFATMYCKGNIRKLNFYDLTISGHITDNLKDNTIHYIAAAPPDRRASFSGSCLPFPNQIHAFDNTPNIGKLELGLNNSFNIKLMTPNSYMVGLGSVTIPPTVYISYTKPDNTNKIISIKVDEPIGYRTLTYPVDPRPRKDATFYSDQFDREVKTQEEMFYDSVYSKTTYPNFWGKRHVN